jgi:hypothetical protein
MLLTMNRTANLNAGDGRIAASQQRSGQKLVANEKAVSQSFISQLAFGHAMGLVKGPIFSKRSGVEALRPARPSALLEIAWKDAWIV